MKTNKFIIFATLALLLLAMAIFTGARVTDVLEQFATDVLIGDDLKLYFGDDSDANISYDETTDNRLEVTGTTVAVVGNAVVTGTLSVNGVTTQTYLIPDDTALNFGDDSDFLLTYVSAYDALSISGATASMLVGVGTAMNDDTVFAFGADGDFSCLYDETTDDWTECTSAAGSGLNLLVGNLKIGNGTPDQTINGEDFYCEGLSEFDGVLNADGGIKIIDDIALTFGSGSDVTLQYDENGNDELQFTGAVGFDSAPILRAGALALDDQAITLGTDADATIVYDETTDDALEITSTNITLTGAVGVTGNVVGTGTITSSIASSIGWSVPSGANTACNTTCTYGCAFGQNTADMSIVACDSADADVCVCAGAN